MGNNLHAFIKFDFAGQSHADCIADFLADLQPEPNQLRRAASQMRAVEQNTLGAVYLVDGFDFCHQLEIRLVGDGIEVILHCHQPANIAQIPEINTLVANALSACRLQSRRLSAPILFRKSSQDQRIPMTLVALMRPSFQAPSLTS